MYNSSKKLYKKSQSHGNIEDLLRNKNNLTVNKNIEVNKPETITNDQIDIQREKTSAPILENQLEKQRTGSDAMICEAKLGQESTLYNKNRNSSAWNTDIKPLDLLNQFYDTKKAQIYKECEDKNKQAQPIDKETKFWDDYVGMQLLGKQKNIIGNVQKSQLENNKDRFSSMEKIKLKLNPGETIDSVLDNTDKYKSMVYASLMDADAMIFSIYKSAMTSSRDLTDIEKQQIEDINSGKNRILQGHIEFVE